LSPSGVGCEHVQAYAITRPVDAFTFRCLLDDHETRAPCEIETYLS